MLTSKFHYYCTCCQHVTPKNTWVSLYFLYKVLTTFPSTSVDQSLPPHLLLPQNLQNVSQSEAWLKYNIKKPPHHAKWQCWLNSDSPFGIIAGSKLLLRTPWRNWSQKHNLQRTTLLCSLPGLLNNKVWFLDLQKMSWSQLLFSRDRQT